jgi:hypothetical protein
MKEIDTLVIWYKKNGIKEIEKGFYLPLENLLRS